ncbi:serine protease [Streptomyces naganishii]|uniref:serine protease n=1 Tax=Streptomyces naganishii TaxID=285447 RepID=UPI003690B54B
MAERPPRATGNSAGPGRGGTDPGTPVRPDPHATPAPATAPDALPGATAPGGGSAALPAAGPATGRHALRTARGARSARPAQAARAGLAGRAGQAGRGGEAEPVAEAPWRVAAEARDRVLDRSLVCVRDLAGRPRGLGFAADHDGTVITSHEAVDGLCRLVLHLPGGEERSCLVTDGAVTPLPGLDLALVRTEGLDAEPLPITVRDGVETGTYVRIAAGGWREARVLGAASVTYTATDRFHLVGNALELAIGTAGRDALRPGGGAAGGPVLDGATGAVVAVLGTALQSGHRDAGFAVPLPPHSLGVTPAGGASAGDVSAGGDCRWGASAGDVSAGGASAWVTSPGDASAGTASTWGASAGDVSAGGACGWGASAGGASPGDASAGASAWRGPAGDVSARGVSAGDVPAGVTYAGVTPGGATPGGVAPAEDDSVGRAALAAVLARNAATVPAYGADLNLAAVLELTATSLAQDGPPGALPPHPSHPLTGLLAGRPTVHGEGAFTPDSPAPSRWPAPQWARRAEHAPAAATTPATHATPPSCPSGLTLTSVERSAPARDLAEFEHGPALVLGVVGAPGSGRTTELAALAARRARGDAPAPTLWLRGADLDGGDACVADAVGRALDRAARIVAASRAPLSTELGDLTPERVARLARAHGRPLLLLLDGPEEMPPDLAHRLADWTEGTARWLRSTGTRLVVACREEYWEEAGARFPSGLLHTPAATAPASGARGHHVPPCLRLGDLTPREAREARSAFGVPDGVLVEADARHPLTLRLLAEVRAALPDPAGLPVLDRDDVLAAHLDLMCLRVAVRLAAENGLRGTAVRRLAAKVSGQVHEAARRSLSPGGGELDRAAFEELFPWGPAPARLGGGTGWASAVLTEGLLVPAGGGYRFAHEELADWIQGIHLDLDEALRVLVHRRRVPGEPDRPLPVPHHRIGPVVQALLLLARQHGTRRLAVRLEELVCALDSDPHSWWASRLLAAVLLRVPDATPYAGVLRLLAERIVAWKECGLPVPDGFGPGFWTALHLTAADRCDLLRRLLLADPAPPSSSTAAAPAAPGAPPPAPHSPRYLDAAAQLLAADPAAVLPHLTRWFDDERPLPAAPHATVATAAQALLHTHRHRALDDLTETLLDRAHPRADELLAVLAEEEPSALCRAVDRWAHDERPDRRAAAVTHALRTAPHARAEADRMLLRQAALTLLARPADAALHGGALALLLRDPEARAHHLPQALRHFAQGDPYLPSAALAPALATHPEAVLTAFGERLGRGGDAGEALGALAAVTTPVLARRVAAPLREAVVRRPETAGAVAAYVGRRLEHDTAARTVLFPLVTGLLDGGPEPLRAALGAVLAGPGAPASRPLRRELLDYLLAHEDDPAVLDAVLRGAAAGAEEDLRDLVHRVGLLLVRTPQGAAVFDRGLVELGRHVPGFAARTAGWLAESPQDWAAVVGPSARRMLENLAGVRVPV